MKRAIKKILFLFFLAAFLSACGEITPAPPAAPPSRGSESAPQTPASTPKTVTPAKKAVSSLGVEAESLKGIEVKVWHPWYGVEASRFGTLVAEFNEKNKWGVRVVAESQVNFTNLYENTAAALPTADRPDLVIALPEHALDWDKSGAVTDLNPYARDPLYGMEMKDIPVVFLNQVNYGGRRLGIPAQRTARLLLWNQTWAKELGFASPPDTPADFQRQSCRAQQAMLKDEAPQNDFMGGWYVDVNPMTAYAWLLAFEGGALDGGGYRFLTPNNIKALRFLRELSESLCAWQAAGTDPLEAFADRRALFVAASLEDLPAAARAFAAAQNTDVWKALPFPGENEDALVVYGSSYMILASSPQNKLAAWLFARWMLENDQDARMAEATHLFPIRASSMELLGSYAKTHPQWEQAIELLPQGEIQPQLASWRQVKTVIGDGFAHMYRVNVPSGQVPAILAQMESIASSLSERFDAPPEQ
jgi:ABC-type glycerol-3-phosphate transport system substrate-binding protein